MSDARQALGLPDGGIRALLALFLISIFVIVTIHLFVRISTPAAVALPGITKEQKDRIAPRDFVSIFDVGNGRYDVKMRVADDPGSERFLQQIFTALLTLATAVSSFYFGARAGDGRRAVNSVVSLTSIAPRQSIRTPVVAKLSGTGFADGARVILNGTLNLDGPNLRNRR